MSFSFPPNPTVGQVYVSNGRSWRWSGTQWTATTIPTNTSAPTYMSVSPPPNAQPGDLWYDTNNANLNIYYKDLNGSQWVSVVPYPMDTITQNGGVFDGPIYGSYLVPNNPAAFVTVQWVQDNLVGYLTQNGYVKAGNGVQLDGNGEILSIDSGLLV